MTEKRDWKKELGGQLREARSDAFLRQQDLGGLVQLHPNMISRYENGDSAPELDVFIRLASALQREEFEVAGYRILIQPKEDGLLASGPIQMRLAYGKEYVFDGENARMKIQPGRDGLLIAADKRKLG